MTVKQQQVNPADLGINAAPLKVEKKTVGLHLEVC